MFGHLKSQLSYYKHSPTVLYEKMLSFFKGTVMYVKPVNHTRFEELTILNVLIMYCILYSAHVYQRQAYSQINKLKKVCNKYAAGTSWKPN